MAQEVSCIAAANATCCTCSKGTSCGKVNILGRSLNLTLFPECCSESEVCTAFGCRPGCEGECKGFRFFDGFGECETCSNLGLACCGPYPPGRCVDLESDNNDCGECGKKCSKSQSCIQGRCECDSADTMSMDAEEYAAGATAVQALGPTEPCGDSCCGPCQTCDNGTCRTCNQCESCDANGNCVPLPNAQPCGDACCGSCQVCDNGTCRACNQCEICDSAGSCTSACSACQVCDDGTCVEQVCPPGQICKDGGCQCPEGTKPCGPFTGWPACIPSTSNCCPDSSRADGGYVCGDGAVVVAKPAVPQPPSAMALPAALRVGTFAVA